MDPFGRIIDYLRISVTDRCNERCLYCMPEGYKGWSQRPDHMTAAEIVRVAESATKLGFQKFRLTGGEPLLRSDIVDIARGLWNLPGVQTLGISTNGTRLASIAGELKQAGVRSVNISLDALDPELYHRVTGGRLDAVLTGIESALAAGFEVIKLNCVLMRGVNEGEYLPLIHFAAKHDMLLRFIELMPLSRTDVLDHSNFLSVSEVMNRIQSDGKLTALPDFRPGHGPARYYDCAIPGLVKPARLGFIGALTTPHFCETCNKLRLTADGKLRPCLGQHGEIDLLQPLRIENADPIELLKEAIANKPENHEFSDCYEPGRPMTAIGG
ncbi:MAG: GTP 3',8-cyclase MoaA [Verrucomicrobiota bacterium]